MVAVVASNTTSTNATAASQDGERIIIVGNYIIDCLRRGKTVEVNGITLLPAEDLTAAPVSESTAEILQRRSRITDAPPERRG